MQTPSPPHCHPRPEEALWLCEGLCSHDPEPCWSPALGPAPIPKTLGEMPHPQTLPVPGTLQGCDSNATPRTALLKASGGFKVLAASELALSREKRCHLGLCPLPTWSLHGFFDGSDLSFEEKQMMFLQLLLQGYFTPCLSYPIVSTGCIHSPGHRQWLRW